MSILITGATGYLGRALVERLVSGENLPDGWSADDLILLGHSEQKADELMRHYGRPVYVGDLCNSFFLERIFNENQIETVVHAAAIKYISVSNLNPLPTIETNVLGSYYLLKQCKKYDVKNLIGISTDKAIGPINIYGLSKRIMEHLFVDSGYTICRGVNFFASSGSVLQIWYNQFQSRKPLSITDKNCVRFFIEVGRMVDLILQTEGRNEILNPDTVWKVKIGDLLQAFMEHYDWHEYEETGLGEGEKLVEEIDPSCQTVQLTQTKLKDMVTQEILKWQSLFQ